MRNRPLRGHRRFRTVMFLVLAAFGLLPLLVVLVASLLAEQGVGEVRTRAALEAAVRYRQATIELFLDQKMRQLELIAMTVPAAELARPDRLETIRGDLQHDGGGIVDLELLDATGRHLAGVGSHDPMRTDYGGQPWFQQVLARGRYLGDGAFRESPRLIIATKKREPEADYVLRASVDTNALAALVRDGALESASDVFVLNRTGQYQIAPSAPGRVGQKADLPPLPVHAGVRIATVDAVRSGQLVATAWLAGDSWVLVGRRDLPTFAGVVRAWPLSMIALAGLLLVPSFALLVARHGLRQVRALEEDRARLHESVAQSERLAAIGRLAATTAHEINNPLAIIAAQVGVLQDTVRGSAFLGEFPELHDRLTKIARQVERGKTVTHRLLGFSRSVGPTAEAVDVTNAVDETISFVAKEAQESNVRFVREYATGVPPVTSNRGQMQQVFLNVIQNAIDAMGLCGEIRVEIRCARGGVEVAVTDSGPGIREADLERVFEPFYSTKGDDTRHCGLGLAICRETMRLLGGRITAENNPGGGAAFIMWFPVQPFG